MEISPNLKDLSNFVLYLDGKNGTTCLVTHLLVRSGMNLEEYLLSFHSFGKRFLFKVSTCYRGNMYYMTYMTLKVNDTLMRRVKFGS